LKEFDIFSEEYDERVEQCLKVFTDGIKEGEEW
jgi:hypothetical protein